MSVGASVAIFTRYPEPGAAKTRLVPAVGTEGAAVVHRRLVEHTLRTVRSSGLDWRVHVTGAPLHAFQDWLGEDVLVVDQGEGDLGARLARAMPPVLLIGTDAPGMTATHLRRAAQALTTDDAVIGPAADGGYWLLGLAKPMPWLFDDMAWGTDRVLAATLDRMRARGIAPLMLETLDDIDRPEDLARWPQFRS